MVLKISVEILHRPIFVSHMRINEQEVFAAMIALKDGQGSFADAVIAALGARMGCSCTLTFDRKALPLPGFELP
jgi:predicted nucleic-acid-binding protein